MRPFKVRTIINNIKKVRSEIPTNTSTTVGVASTAYIDYTNFQEGFIMAYDADRNRYHYVDPQDFFNLNIDYGEY